MNKKLGMVPKGHRSWTMVLLLTHDNLLLSRLSIKKTFKYVIEIMHYYFHGCVFIDTGGPFLFYLFIFIFIFDLGH